MNKTLKKTLSIILTILMIVTTVPFAFAADIVDSGTCGADGDNLTWTLDADGTLTISGEGAMAEYYIYNYPESGMFIPPWAGYKENIKAIIIEEGVTELGRFAFYGHTAVKDVSIANSVTTFTGREFHGCSAIEKLIIPAGVSILSSTSFRECSSLKQIVFLGKVDIDNFYAFDGCSELREIVFAKGATNSQDVSYPFTIDDINADEIVIHFGGTQAEADEAFAPISEMDKIYSVATIHYMDGCNCSDCDFALAHSGGTATCIDLAVCQVCETVYGEVDADAHDWIRNILVRPTRNTDGSWTDGYYYDKCKNDEAHNVLIGIAKRADYTAYDNACAKLSEYFSYVELTEAAIEEIRNTLALTTMVPSNLVEGESSLAFMNNWVKSAETIIAKIESGEYVKVDNTEIAEVINAIAEVLETAKISEEMENELIDIKAQLEPLKENENLTMADVIELYKRLDAITKTMENCANGVHEFGEYTSNGDATCEADGTKTAECIHGCGVTDTVADEGSMLDHADKDGDGKCDNGGEQLTCEDCGRPAHGESFFESLICMITMLINLIESMFA